MKTFKTIQYTPDVGSQIRTTLEEYLVVHVEGSPIDVNWQDQAKKIGELYVMDEDKVTGNKTGNFWIDIKYDANYPDLFIHANTRQPLHTDGSYEANAPNITFFYCIEEAKIGGATTFISPEIIKTCLKLENPELLDRLETLPLTFSKGNDSKTIPVFSNGKVNWNYFRTDKGQLATEFHEFLENRIINMGIQEGIRLKPGEALFFQDEYIFHGRNAFIGNRWLRKGGIKWTGTHSKN